MNIGLRCPIYSSEVMKAQPEIPIPLQDKNREYSKQNE